MALQQLGDKNRQDAFIWQQAERNIEVTKEIDRVE
jgi:predicted nuclease of predicted toxin-antitoxin system